MIVAFTRAQIQARWRAKSQAGLPRVPCGCGCGEMIPSITKNGQPAQFKRGHRLRLPNAGQFQRGQKPWNYLAGFNRAQRQARHRAKTYAQWDALLKIPCQCGCGSMIRPFTRQGMPARYAHGHNPSKRATGHTPWNKGRRLPPSWNKGKTTPPEVIAKWASARRANHGGEWGGYRMPGTWHPSAETRERQRLANQRNARPGHLNPAWEGGKSFEPYDAGFNAAIKREVLRRDGHTCQDCGAPIGRRKGHRKANIHHIDHNKLNTTMNNLVALCVPCHARRHWSVRKVRGAVAE